MDKRLIKRCLFFVERSTTKSLTHPIQNLPVTSSNALITTTIVVTNQSSSIYWTLQLFLTVHFAIIISMIHLAASINEIVFLSSM
jgi:hypothetical protein